MALSHRGRRAVTVAGILLPTCFVAMLFPPALMFSSTTATGGDLGSHNYAAQWLRHLLSDEFRMTGWVPGNYCGFPLFQMYFPAPFVFCAVLALAIEPNVAFKLTSVLGLLVLPSAAWFLLRRLMVPFPGPQVGASLTLLFLFQRGNSMWGGNVASTLAGEFVYSISLPLALVYLGLHDRLTATLRTAAAGAVLVALLSMTHAYTVLWLALTAGLAAVRQRRFIETGLRTATVFVWGGALCAFWLIPLLWYSPWTTAYRHVWIINSIVEVLPPTLWPAIAGAIALPVLISFKGAGALAAYGRRTALLHIAAIAAVVAYAAAPNFGIVDVRFLPFLQLMICLIAAAAVGHALEGVAASWLWVPIVFLAAVLLSLPQLPTLRNWSRWNYEGYEGKAAWPVYAELSRVLRGDFRDPRVVYEHSLEHEALGTVRAFENLPLFSGRSTLEGVNLQASVTSPFVFYIQSEISKVMSCPFPEWGCSRPDLARGIEHLRMMNVSDVILRSDMAKAAAATLPEDLERRATVGSYEIYRILRNREGYVVPLTERPYAVVTDDWKSEAYAWFKRATSRDAMPVFVSDARETEHEPFSGVVRHVGEFSPRESHREVSMVRAEVIEPERVAVSGVVPGEPLLIRISYHPRWRSANGERIWLAGQGFMLVFPSTDRVDLIYSQTAVTRAASAISGVSVVGTILVFAGMFQVRSRSARQPKWGGNSVGQSERTASTGPQKSYKSPSFVTGICVTSALLIASGYRARSQDADIVYRSAQRELDRGNMAEARARFVRARSLAPFSNTAIHSFYFEAIAFYREEKWSEASAVFQQLLRTFPEAPSAAEAKYHIGLCADRLGRRQEAIAAMNETRLRYPMTIWSEFAESRLREWGER